MDFPKLFSSPTVARIAVRLLLAILTILVIRACLPERTALGGDPLVGTNRHLIIVPTDGLPSLFLDGLRTRLAEQHKFEVLTTVQMALPTDTEIGTTGQHDIEKIGRAGWEVCHGISTSNEYCVVLTNRDINVKNSGLRYLFSQHRKGISVVSTARLSDANFGARLNLISAPIIAERTISRTAKLINKGVGLGYYGYALSTNRNSVMFAPVMSLSDLDSVGDWYQADEVKRDNFSGSY